jgi:hypothetical protein
LSVLHLICLSDVSISPKVKSAIQDRLGNAHEHHIISLSAWYGSNSISDVKVKLIFKSSLLRFLRDFRYFSLHPKSHVDSLPAGSFYLDANKIKAVLNMDVDHVFIYSDSEESSKVLSNLIALAGDSKNPKIEIVMVRRFDSDASHGATEPSGTALSSKSLLVIQPDWMYCGSAKTFDLIGNLAVGNGFFPVRITTGTGSKRGKIQVGNLHSNGSHGKFPGVSAKVNLSSNKSKVTLVRNLLQYLLSPNRRSVVEFKNQVYGSLRIGADLRQIIERISPEYIYVNHHFNLPLALRIQKQLSKNGLRPKIILDSHDLQHRNYRDQNYKSPFSIYFDTQVDEMAIEFSQFQDADAVIFVSEEERQAYLGFLNDHSFRHNPTFYSIPTQHTEQRLIEPPPKNFDGLLIGIFMADNSANRISLNWFFQNVLHRFDDLQASFVIYGGISKVKDLYPRSVKVDFRGFVESLADAYAEIDIVCMPVVVGNGVAIKTLEALEFEKPIIGTALAGRGLPVRDSFLFATNAEQFIQTTRSLILSQTVRVKHVQEAKLLKSKIEELSYEKQFRDFFI